jgi:hypothetical protein
MAQLVVVVICHSDLADLVTFVKKNLVSILFFNACDKTSRRLVDCSIVQLLRGLINRKVVQLLRGLID